ncbi:hypothetical protein P9869_20905 [Streptomyces ossamyceticus]|nr:hypothetical protein [Streptomyces ossamyceticus]
MLTCGFFSISPQQWSMLPESRRYDYDLYRELTNANLPLQDTPMHGLVGPVPWQPDPRVRIAFTPA